MKYGVDIMVLSSLEDKPGTLVTKEDKDMERVVVSGVTYDKNQAKVTFLGVPDKPGIVANIFGDLADANINVDVIVQTVSLDGKANVSFTVAKTDLPRALDTCKEVAKKLEAEDVISDENISKISIVGLGMKSHAGVASDMFKVLAENNINILMITTSEIKVSCVIEEKYTELAVRVLHERFVREGDSVS